MNTGKEQLFRMLDNLVSMKARLMPTIEKYLTNVNWDEHRKIIERQVIICQKEPDDFVKVKAIAVIELIAKADHDFDVCMLLNYITEQDIEDFRQHINLIDEGYASRWSL